MEIDKKIIKKLVDALEDLKKSINVDEIIDSEKTVEEKIDISGEHVKSPIVGTAYLSPEPGAKPFVSVGKKIKKGETLLIVDNLPFALIFILFIFFILYNCRMNNIIIINGPNINLLGEREQSQYGSITFLQLKKKCLEKTKELNLDLNFTQSNIEGEIVTIIQNARNEYDGMIINAAGFTHTSVSIRDALDIYKKPIIELHISNIYKREEFRHKSMISNVVTGIICGLGADGYILAINAMHELLKNGNR